MSAKAIFEADGKAILSYHLTRAPVIKPTPLPKSATHNPPPKLASLYFAADADINGVLDQAEATYPWLLTPGSKFVAKPDQLIKRRGKSGLLSLNKPWSEARTWIEARAGKAQKVETVDGVLRHFLVEPFVPHEQDTEYYININSVREVRSSSLSFCLSFSRINWFQASSRCPVARGGKEFWLQMHICYNGKLAQKFAGDLPGFVQRRPGEGSPKPDPLLQSTHPDKRVGFHMSNLLLVRLQSCRTGRTEDFSPRFVLRLCRCSVGCYFGRANHIYDTWLTFSA